jgi:hypothetical protein
MRGEERKRWDVRGRTEVGSYRVWVGKPAASKLISLGVDVDWIDLAQDTKSDMLLLIRY